MQSSCRAKQKWVTNSKCLDILNFLSKIFSTAVAPPVIETQPESVSVGVSGPATFTVVASGEEPLTYQWFGPGGALSDISGEIDGATTATLQVFNVQSDDEGNYRVRVTNVGGSVDSNIASLTISKQLSEF